MKVFKVLKEPRYMALAILSSVGMLAFYAYTQVLGAVQNLDLWIAVMPWYNKILVSVFVSLFGIATSYQIYLWKRPKACSISAKGGAVGVSSVGTLGVFMVAQCPACASLTAFLLLPLSATVFLASFGWVITLIGIAMILFTINYLGGFKR